MCARFTLAAVDAKFVAFYFQLNDVPELPPRYNIAPSQKIATIGAKSDGTTRGLAMMQWGFVPHWASSPADGPKPVNARSETVRTSPPFRDSFRSRRCLIPADGFYEWQTQGKQKIPHRFSPKGGGLLALAGIYDVWKSPGLPSLFTCAILTVPANDALKPFHDRMPAILQPAQFAAWLNPATQPDDAMRFLATSPDDMLAIDRANKALNKANFEGPECWRVD